MTALVLAPIAIACIFFLPTLGFSLFIATMLVVGAWEWANFAGFEANQRFAYGLLIAMLLAISTALPAGIVLSLGCVWWCLGLILVVRYPGLTELWSSKLSISLIGVLCLVPGYVALMTLKQSADSSFLILLLFFLIWGADIGAYFAGKRFGKRKLAPKVSPGKSWEGFAGGLVVATIIAVAMLLWLGKPDLTSLRGLGLLLGCVLVVMISVLGDLVESMFKRNRGIKDSSNLLPGHGGVLDRLDSLLSAGPAFALLILIFGWT